LKNYIDTIRKIQENAHLWNDERIEEYKHTYEAKLKYENRIFFRGKLKEIEETKKKWKLHNNRVNELNNIAYDIAERSDLTIEPEEIYLPSSTIEQDMLLVREYALFPEKKHLDEVITDRTMTNKDMNCFGMIKMIEIKRIENGV